MVGLVRIVIVKVILMIKMEKVTITIDREIYKKLAQMKLDKDLRTFDEVLLNILSNQKKCRMLDNEAKQEFCEQEKKQ
jgi:predicted CopG family antitoxin